MSSTHSVPSSSTLLLSKILKTHFPEKIILRARAAGWIAPAQSRPGFTLWPDDTIANLKARLMAGEYPPPLPCEIRLREKAKAKAALAKKEEISHAN